VTCKSGGLIVRDVGYTPVGAGVTVLDRVTLILPPTGPPLTPNLPPQIINSAP